VKTIIAAFISVSRAIGRYCASGLYKDTRYEVAASLPWLERAWRADRPHWCQAGASGNAVRGAGCIRIVVLTFALLIAATFPTLADHASGHASQPTLSPATPGALDPLKSLGLDLAPPVGSGGFLQPDEAFALSAEVRGPNLIVVRWIIADTYYLYRDRFSFTAVPPVTDLDKPRLPPGMRKQDPYLGEVEVYYHSVEILLPLARRESGATEVTLQIGFQGCTDIGLCYPPITKPVTLALPSLKLR
jgi:hypothetical protein